MINLRIPEKNLKTRPYNEDPHKNLQSLHEKNEAWNHKFVVQKFFSFKDQYEYFVTA